MTGPRGARLAHAPGTSSGKRQTAILIPVPAAEPVVGHWRDLYDPPATVGVPAHITLIVPWLPPDEVTDADIDELRELAVGVEAFDFELTRIGWFGRRVVWIAPRPEETFLSLTARLAERFGTPPWEDEFDEVVPHLTVAHASGDGVELASVASDVAEQLPIRCRATEVWVMIADGQRWTVRAVLPFAKTGGQAGSTLNGLEQ